MTIVRLGFVAMSTELKNASPSKTMTYAQFIKIEDRNAAIHKLEQIATTNIENTLRLLKHAVASEIYFYRFTSRLIPLATHAELANWDYLKRTKASLREVGNFVKHHKLRVDFHPDHFVIINAKEKHIFKNSIHILKHHYLLLKAMGIDTRHRCVLHIGGKYNNPALSLERFVENWMSIPYELQQLIMLENDDTSFTLEDTLYLCEKLDIPLVFDYHHHLAYHVNDNWEASWQRIVNTWRHSPFPLKMHISSPKSEKAFRHHADFVNADMFFRFLHSIKGSIPQIDCMIEAKQKDRALFQLMKEIKTRQDVKIIDGSTFQLL